MKAIIINNSNALILDVSDSTIEDNEKIMRLKVSNHPVTVVKTDISKTIIVNTGYDEQDTEVSNNIAEALVGPNGQITKYNVSEKKKSLRYTKNKTD